MATQVSLTLLQMNSQDDPKENADWIRRTILSNEHRSQSLVLAPENALYCGPSTGLKKAVLQLEEQVLSDLQVSLHSGGFRGVLVLGGVPQRVPGTLRYRNRWLILDRGRWRWAYTKQHLFRASVPGQQSHNETVHFHAGRHPLRLEKFSSNGARVHVGPSTCFDLRFPEMYRQYRKKGAQILAVPSAFTALTGAAHWHVLLRARAIENQCFVVAPAQAGRHPGGRQTYGHSLVVNPWGEVILDAAEKVGAFDVSLPMDDLKRVRAQVVMEARASRR